MSNKDFKEGMVAGAKPFGDKLDQLAKVSENAVSDIKEGLDGVTQVVNIVLDDLSAQEKKRIYDLDEATDISALEYDEKEFLVALLAELANSIPEVTDLQKRYIMSICSTVGIAAPQTSLNLMCIENIENMRTQKILLRHVIEFFFIGTQNYDFLDYYENAIFCYFGVNQRGVSEIINTVDRIYNSMGIEGVANRYTFAAGYQDMVKEETDTSEEMENYFNEHTAYTGDLEEVNLTDILHINNDESIIYKHKRVSINSIVTIDGTLEFDNCVVDFYYDDAPAFFSINGTLKFSMCEIISRTDNMQHIDDKKDFLGKSIINGSDSSTIIFENCLIQNAGHFISTTGELNIDGCTICNPGIRFISLSIAKESKIANTIVEFSEELHLEKASTDYGARDIIYAFTSQQTIATSALKIENCKFICSTPDTITGVIPVHAPCMISNCEFYNFAKVKCTIFANSLHKNYFENCIGIVAATVTDCTALQCSQIGLRSDSLIDNCDFNDCKYIVVPENSVLRNSRFVNSQGRIVNAKESSIEHCTFLNIRKWNKGVSTSSLSELNFAVYMVDSSMDACIFEGIELKDNAFLIVGEQHSTSTKKVEIKKCVFRKCYTDRSDKQIVAAQEHYGIISSKIRSINPIQNCVGLEAVKCGSLDAEAPVIDSPRNSGIIAGTLVGAAFGVGGAAIGGIIGAAIDSMPKKNT